MTSETFVPCNAFEEALIKGMDGRLAVEEVLACLLNADVYIPSGSDIAQDGSGMSPLMFDRDNSTFVAIFSDRQRALPFVGKAPYCLMMKGKEMLKCISLQVGIVINPGWDVGMEVTVEGLNNVRRALAIDL